MKKSLGLKICASILVAPIFAMFANAAYAADTVTYKVTVGGEDIYTSGENADETAAFDSVDTDSGVLTLNGYSGEAISTNLTSLRIVVEKDSTAKSIEAGGLTIEGSAQLTVSGNIVAKGTIKLNGKVSAASIILNATNLTDKIMFDEKADVSVTKNIIANYTSTTTNKGIALNKVCASSDASIINVSGTGTYKTQTVFSTDGTKGVSNGIKVNSASCTAAKTDDKNAKKDTTKNPDTLDAIYYYVAALVASSAILIYRRHLAKR